jgi:outer membrane lipoprotein-sorting protein
MKNLAVLICMTLLANAAMIAQDSNTLLDELSKKAKGYTSIAADYDSRLLDVQAGLDISQSGSIKVSGEKYNLDLSDYVIVNDGETFWSFDKAGNTVQIDYAEDMADGSLQPSQMFTIWEQDFKNEYKGETTENGKACHVIYLYPNDPTSKPYHTIQLSIDKAKMEVVKIVVKGREGQDMIYDVKSFKPNEGVSEDDFTFDIKAHPGIEVIDNR